MSLSFAIVGFRHGHIYDLAHRVNAHPEHKLVAVCEEDATTRAAVIQSGVCDRVYDSFDAMLAEVDFEVLGIGDYFAKRGSLVIKGMGHGKHIISDKPVCTSLEELEIIGDIQRSSGCHLGCQLDIRDNANFRTLRQIMREGAIGDIRAVTFGGQHALLESTRAGWYFEPGKQGGTINDIAVHAFDYIPWLTGHAFASVNCARTWNMEFPAVPHFHNAAQLMLTLDNGAGVMGDVSYHSPNSFVNNVPQYWRTTLWGTKGIAETSYSAEGVALFIDGAEARVVAPLPANPGGYVDHFLAELAGESREDHLTTADVLRVSRVSLLAQQAADKGEFNLSLA